MNIVEKSNLHYLCSCLHQVCMYAFQIFTLSAIPFDNMLATLERCVSVLKPGGLVLFRDYGNALAILLYYISLINNLADISLLY